MASLGSRVESFNPQLLAKLINGNYKLYGHNLYAADFPILKANNILNCDLPLGSVHDTMLSAHVTHGHLAGEGSYDLRSVCLLYGQDKLNLDFKDYANDIFGTCRYDAIHSLWVGRQQDKIIDRDGLRSTWATSHRMAPIFQRMYERGVRLDKNVLQLIHEERETQRTIKQQSIPLIEHRKEYKRKEAKVWSEPLNPRSPEVIKWFKDNGVELKGRSREDFERVAGSKKVPEHVRQLAQTFVDISELGSDSFWIGKKTADGWEKIDSNDFCHPEYKITGTPDRTSCVGTNIQNFPRIGDDPRKVPLRSSVIPPEDGMVILACDAKSVENITNALEMGDMDRVRYVLDRDFHQETADKFNAAFSLGLTRQDGKTLNHSFDKAEGPYNLSARLGINVTMAEQIIEAQLRMFPVTAAARKKLWEACRENPYKARTMFGRQLLCFGRSKYGEDDSYSYNAKCKSKTSLFWTCTCKSCAPIRERFKSAIAFLGRATAVDIVYRKTAQVWEEKRLDDYSLTYFHVHDEAGYAIPVERADKYRKIVLDTFQEPVLELGLSFPMEAGLGKTWAEAK